MNYNNLCYQCFCEKPIRDKPCPKCGCKDAPNALSPNCLLAGTLLKGRYIVGKALGVGGFGITYKCLDTKVGVICAIKEYFPSNFAMRNGNTKTVSVAEQNIAKYNKILKRFVEEAVMVRKLKHRNIITIYDSFFENNTAYYVMEYCDGVDLRKYTNNFTRKLEYAEGLNLLYQIMNGLEYVHSKGILHRDIAPDNIYVTKNNSVKILDFGSARSEMDQLNRELSVIVKVGYAPIEQYGGRGKQGPYTDIYALGATFYHLFTSRAPVESTQRVAEDNLEVFSKLRPDLPDNLKYCIEKSMEVTTARRISNIAEMKRILGLGNETVNKSASGGRGKRPAAGAVNNGAPVVSRNVSRNVSGNVSRNVSGNVSRASVVSRNPNSSKNGYNIAGVSKRMGAYAVDLLIWGVVYFIILLGAISEATMAIGFAVLFPVVFTVINTVSELLSATTIGKAIFGLYVRGKSSYEAMPSQILFRNIIKLLNVLVLVFANGDELLEDKVTDSIVCEKK